LDGIDVVVIARAGLRTADTPAVTDALSRHWQRLARQCVRR
jgi:RNase P protein component